MSDFPVIVVSLTWNISTQRRLVGSGNRSIINIAIIDLGLRDCRRHPTPYAPHGGFQD